MKKTKDIWLAGFIQVIKKNKPANYLKNDRGILTFEFDLSDDEWKKINLEYIESDVQKVLKTVDSLKRLSI